MKIFMIDNYHSFTYNLVQYFQILGAEVVVKRNYQTTIEEIRELDPDAIVISPGPCSPKEAGISVKVVQELYRDYPILGVCLGHQSIGYALWSKHSPGKKANARKDLPHYSHRRGHIFWNSQSLYCS
jgi:Anthranilate/para-aminobenzoate synthases component II